MKITENIQARIASISGAVILLALGIGPENPPGKKRAVT